MIVLKHHSRYLAYRDPQGAVPCGASARIAMDVSGVSTVTLRLYEEGGGEKLYDMPIQNGRAETTVTLPDKPCLVWYSFRIRASDGSCWQYGAESGEGVLTSGEPAGYRITVYDGAFQTPRQWREGVVYQIFPDRFKRSSWEDFRARAQTHLGKGRFLRIHDRWSERMSYLPAPGQKNYAPDDFFGGDLNGIREKLAYLSDLGVTTIYLNPIFESASNHRYNTADYLCIDPILGTNEDFAALCREARTFGIRIMLDGVFSHTGSDSRYFDSEHRYDELGASESEESPYRSWYSFNADGSYSCWWDFPTLPNVNELEPSYTDFIAGENGVLRHWAKLGAVDWRLDVADELPDEFIRILRKRLKANDPEATLLGEVWEDCSNKYGEAGRRRYVDGDELDSTMNYPFTNATIAFLTRRTDAYAYNDFLQRQREAYPRPFYEACLNLLSSHDVVRASSALAGAPARDALPREQQATFRPSEADAARGRERLLLATALQVGVPGVPCVYYGDEAGMTGMADPFNRGTYPWGEEDEALQGAFRRLLRARRDTPALRAGCCRMGALSPETFAVARYLPGGQSVAVLLVNSGETEQTVVFEPKRFCEGTDGDTPVSLPPRMREALTDATLLPQNDMLTDTLPPLTARLWIG